MNLIAGIIAIIQGIIDRLPSRKEALLNRIQDIKDELKKMQDDKSPWTVAKSGAYYQLTSELSTLEKRAVNVA